MSRAFSLGRLVISAAVGVVLTAITFEIWSYEACCIETVIGRGIPLTYYREFYVIGFATEFYPASFAVDSVLWLTLTYIVLWLGDSLRAGMKPWPRLRYFQTVGMVLLLGMLFTVTGTYLLFPKAICDPSLAACANTLSSPYLLILGASLLALGAIASQIPKSSQIIPPSL